MYGSQGIQPERWAIEVGKEIRCEQSQHRQGKGKTLEQKERDKRRKAEIRELKKTGQYTATKKPPPSWFQCSCCMAKAGIGSHKAGKLIGVSPSTVTRQWNDFGIRAEIPSNTGWHMIARATRTAQKEAEELPFKAYKEAAMKEIRQHRSKTVYPCWSVLLNVTADPEYHRAKTLAKYHALTATQKRERNQKIQAGRNKESQAEYLKKWRSQNPDKYREGMRRYMRERKASDPGFKIACNMRNRFKDIMGVVLDPTKKWNSSLIGCDTSQLAAHLQAQFKHGMSWENYGTHWHVDHIVPCSKFDHTIPAHVRQCWHYTNLQPLWAEENLAKSDTVYADTQLSLTL